MVIDAANNVSYTCLKVDPAPDNLQFDGVAEDSVVIPITTAQNITDVTISWKPSAASGAGVASCPAAPAPGNPVFSPRSGPGAWSCPYGVLRADVVPTSGALTRANLTGGLLSGYFVPNRTNTNTSLDYGADRGKANVVPVSCAAVCTANITNLGGSQSLSLRLSALYVPSSITVAAFNNATQLKISGVQAVIDATGKATDVLRRIQVRLPIVRTSGLMPGDAIASNGAICKRFSVTNGYLSIPGDIADRDTNNDMCNPMSQGMPGGP
jgi:hypothetical protein